MVLMDIISVVLQKCPRAYGSIRDNLEADEEIHAKDQQFNEEGGASKEGSDYQNRS